MAEICAQAPQDRLTGIEFAAIEKPFSTASPAILPARGTRKSAPGPGRPGPKPARAAARGGIQPLCLAWVD